jgi:3-hydroxyacyl-[acyl-carrier-protein] dehydratase
MRLLPHRYPFLLLDTVTECVPGERISGIKNVARGQPDLRMFGGVWCISPLLLVEALAQLSVILTYRTLGIAPSGDELLFFAGIDRATFARGAEAGETVQLSSKVTRLRQSRGIGVFATVATINDRVVVEASLMAALQLGSPRNT